MINFVKTLAYPLHSDTEDDYAHVRAITLQQLDPPPLQPGTLKIASSTVLHSPLRRVVDSLDRLPDTQYVCLPELAELQFDLAALCSREEYLSQGSHIVRARLVDAFIHDALPVSRETLFKEAHLVLSRSCQKYDVTIVSHSFRLKLLEAMIDTDGQIQQNPALLGRYIAPDQKTYPFGGGFSKTQAEVSHAIGS